MSAQVQQNAAATKVADAAVKDSLKQAVSQPVVTKKFQTFPDYGFACTRPWVATKNAFNQGFCGCGPICGPCGVVALPVVHQLNRVTALTLGRTTQHTAQGGLCLPLMHDTGKACVLADPLNVCSVNVCSNVPFLSDVFFVTVLSKFVLFCLWKWYLKCACRQTCSKSA